MTDLPKIVDKKKKRKGRGYGSAKGGHTVGRGQKGQKSRRSIGILFEGMKVKKSLIKRLPQLRGKDKNKPRPKPVIFNLSDLKDWPANTKVNIENLVKRGFIDEKKAKRLGVKLLGQGKIEKGFTVEVEVSKSAAKKIEKAGGKVENKS
jgi:large subunit ribosomal protein L15